MKVCKATDRPNSFVLMLRYCANLKAIRYVSKSLSRVYDENLLGCKSEATSVRFLFSILIDLSTKTITRLNRRISRSRYDLMETRL